MQRETLALAWGGRVYSENGWGARLLGAFLSPRTGYVTHVLVKRGLFSKPEAYRLEGAVVDQDGMPVLRAGAADAPGRGSVRLTAKTMVSLGSVVVPLGGFIVDLQRKTPRRLLVRYRGSLRVLGYDQTHGLSSGSPSARLSAEEQAGLPFYRRDADALRNAIVALGETSSLAAETFARVEMQVIDGMAYLGGNVRLSLQRGEAERVVRGAKGVIEVRNEVASDEELRLKIAAGLVRECISRRGLVTVRSLYGAVTLQGWLPSQELAERAAALAKGIRGVRSVATALAVEETPQRGETSSEPEAVPAARG
ncbi:MAG: BON domain-containing protein [Chloroflexi bacterium]|nr:BON domain-containing protein [Chloroflexota bacterium]